MTARDVLRIIGLVLWVILRISVTIFIMFLAIVFGGFRGAAKSKSGGTSVHD